MERKTKGLLAESKAISYLIENGYDVFLPFAENGSIDLIGIKDSQISRISVKATSSKSKYDRWIVQLKTCSRRKDNKIKTNQFDKTLVDKILVYIIPLDKIVEIQSKDVNGKFALNIDMEGSESGS